MFDTCVWGIGKTVLKLWRGLWYARIITEIHTDFVGETQEIGEKSILAGDRSDVRGSRAVVLMSPSTRATVLMSWEQSLTLMPHRIFGPSSWDPSKQLKKRQKSSIYSTGPTPAHREGG